MITVGSVVRKGNEIYLTVFGKKDDSKSKIKVGTKDCPWSRTLGDNFLKEREWIKDEGLAQISVSVAVILSCGCGERATILYEFDQGHDVIPGKLSLPSGLWKEGSLKQAALNVLGKKIMIKIVKHFFPWSYKGNKLSVDRVSDFAKENDSSIGVDSAEVLDVENEDGQYKIYVDGEYQVDAILACEPETGRIEIISLFRSDDRLMYWELFDGERLHREVGVFTVEDLEKKHETGKLTTKAQAVLAFMKNL